MDANTKNRRFVLAERPVGEPDEKTLRLEAVDVPVAGQGDMLLKTRYLSLDPYMRGRMNDAPSYAAPVEIDEVMVGGTIAEVVQSNLPRFKPGDLVLSMNGWQDYALSDGKGVLNLGQEPQNPSWYLGIMGMPGFTAYVGTLKIGKPKEDETLVVAAATGAVGAVVGQIAKMKGCRVVGVAGGAKKCTHAINTQGFDACIDHKADDFADQLAAACPDGIDIYYENVGGKVFQAVLPLLNPHSRVPVCGIISHYNDTALPEGPNLTPRLMGAILRKKILVQGFIIFDWYQDYHAEFQKEMHSWIDKGLIRYREHVVDGFDNTPSAFNDLLAGRNFGKMVIKVS